MSMLHKVNLLPWRDARREAHKRRFLGLVTLGVLLAVLMQFAAGEYLGGQMALQQERIGYLQQHIFSLDQQIAKLKIAEEEHKALLTRLTVVEQLQQKRNKTTEFMNQMPNLIPEGVYVDKIKMNGHQIEITGISDSTARLATMLDNLEKSDKLTDVEMHEIVSGNKRFGKQFQSFKVSFQILTPASNPQAGGAQNG
ncbi:pilus assembly protein PilN [Vibrio cholerae]|uniref:Pilus assembly protein PilN n=2 Tax=Vibrio cholerae TaxID=666 RepID=A0A7Z7YF11_VIBCL|nr:pilus assembly protein PilN [Vibrio cholerae]EGQ8590843.1 pilus assembly protein PilN [Vibrio cholerae]EGQ8659980.1 pilus assembly protein PilN [Vibrio cholerae]EGQ9322934.1 PilN domain-containing protein [Vibrio cholerae]EGR0012820.1 PilN domain-containing protein [Vibrio cholerae]